MKKFNLAIFAVLLLTLLLGACAPKPVSKFGAFGYAQALEFKELYTQTYRQETSTSAAFEIWWSYVDNSFGQLKDANFLAQNCYSNVYQVLSDASIGIYDTGHAEDGAPTTGILDSKQMFSALMTNNLYPANADKCSEIMAENVKMMALVRTNSFQYQVNFIEQKRVLENIYNDTLGKAAGKRFLDLYGQEFITFANGLLEKGGVEPFPADFIGFPTSGLTAKTTDRDWYNTYADIFDGITRPSDRRFSKEMYMVTWSGPENKGTGILYRQAAYEFMNRSFMSRSTQNAINCGSGAPSLSETMNDQCTPVPNNPSVAPTATVDPKTNR